MARKKSFKIQFGYGQMKEMITCFLVLILDKEEVGIGEEDSIYELLKKVKVGC